MTSQFNFFDGMGGADETVPHLPEGLLLARTDWQGRVGRAPRRRARIAIP